VWENCANLQQKQNPLRTNKTSERKRRRRHARKNTHFDRERKREREIVLVHGLQIRSDIIYIYWKKIFKTERRLEMMFMMRARSNNGASLLVVGSEGKSRRSEKKTTKKSSNSENKKSLASSSTKTNEFKLPSMKVKVVDIDILKRFTRERREQEKKKKKTINNTMRKENEAMKKTSKKDKDAKAVVSVPSSRSRSPHTTPSFAWLTYWAFGATAVTTVAAGAFFLIFAKSTGKRGKREDYGVDASMQQITFVFDTPQTAAVRNKAPRPPRRSEDQHVQKQQEISRQRKEEEVNPFLKQMEESNVAFTSASPPPSSTSPPRPQPFETEPSSGQIATPGPSSPTGYVVPKQAETIERTMQTPSRAAAVFDGKKVDEIKKEFSQWALSYDDELHPWDRALDNKKYDAIATTSSPSSTVHEVKDTDRNSSSSDDAHEKREKDKKIREVARRRRNSYFAAVSSKRYAPTMKEQLALEEKVRERLASNTPIFDTEGTFFANESKKEAIALYGTALGKLFYEKSPTKIVGEGTFSDVFSAQKDAGSTSQSLSLSKFDFYTQSESVLKCSAPFPGRDAFDVAQGDGYGFGKVETTVLATLPKHPAIVEVIAAFLESDRNESYLLLKDVGENAHEARKKGRLTPRECRAMARRILHALKHCHERNVIHRDIKSGNILIRGREGAEDFNRKATIIDFGVAHSQTACELYFPETLTNTNEDDERSGVRKNMVCSVEYDPSSGTPGYQAPEVLLGKYSDNEDGDDEEVTMETYAKVDIFAFAIAMYFLCTGKEIFADSLDAGENMTTKSKQKAKAMSETELDRLNQKELELDARVLTQMLTYPDFRLAPLQEKKLRERYGNLVKNRSEIIQSTTLTEKVIEDLSGRQPVAFCKLIAKCLSVDPSKRPSAEEALAWENAFVGTDEDEDILAFLKASTMTTR
jgi:serine/threonine protein kinase